jgi:hypothetical protein
VKKKGILLFVPSLLSHLCSGTYFRETKKEGNPKSFTKKKKNMTIKDFEENTNPNP